MARYQRRDAFFRKAREQGLPSRAAFKLEEIITRFNLVRNGARVIDLGCAPGGWLAVIARAAGSDGRVVGVDLAVCASISSNVVTMAGDIRDERTRKTAADALGSAADLVTSDLSPKLTGIREHDQMRSAELIGAALAFSRGVLRSGGAMVVKLFMGTEFPQIRDLFAREFAHVEVVRTRASRPGSAELYIVARGFNRAAHSQ
jgi:23S rRNA (uridine2552-2'-O)-methyltransferase